MPQNYTPSPSELYQYANAVATEMGRTTAVCKIAAEYPQYGDRLYARLSPDHRLMLGCLNQVGVQVGPLLRAA